MLKRLLVGLDGSALAESSLPYAETLARASGAVVILVRAAGDHEGTREQDANPSLLPYMVAYPPNAPQAENIAQRAARHEPAAYLDGVAERLGRHGVVTETVVVNGRPGDVLLSEATGRDADLILVTTHGRSGLGRWAFGSVAETVLARSPVPVLIVRAWSSPHPLVPPAGKPSIVMPLDGSPFAETAIPLALELARLLQAAVCLTRMVPLPRVAPSLEPEVVDEYSPEFRGELERDAREYLGAVSARVRATGIEVETDVRFADPAGGILASAHEREAGLIVMATHGRTGLASTLLGTVSLEVLHRGDLPVLFVRNAAPAAG